MAAKNTNAPSKYEDIIKKSVRIHSGTPAVYKLTTKMEETENEKRVTFGEKNENKVNKTILLVGETGSGKSTLINVLINYSMGVKWEDEVWFQIVEEEKTWRSQYESQTSDVIVYEIFGFEDQTLPYSLAIIDTPGFGDTRGTKQDAIISHKLLHLFRSEDGVHEVHAVGLVMKSTDNRLSDRLRYIFDAMMSLFGKDLEKNIVLLITHSNGRTPKIPLQALEATKIKCAQNEKNQPVHFLFDNCQNEDRSEETEHLQHAENFTMTGMREFTEFLGKTAPQKLKITENVLNDRIRLTACIQNLHDRIRDTELKQKEITQIQKVLKEHKEMKKNVEVDEVYKEKENIRGGMWGLFFYEGATCCTVCEENCHYPGCTVAWYPEYCEVMKDGCCTVCTKKCPASVHVKEKFRYVTKTRKVKKTLEEMKLKYEKNKTESEKKLSLLENVENEMKQLTVEKSQFLDESYQHVIRLEQIALKADSASTIVHLDFLIEKMKEEGDTVKVQKLEEMRSRVDEGTRAALGYMTKNRTDIISSCIRIHSGPPAVYQLRPKKQKFGTLTRMTVGEKNPNKPNKTILVVGETGAGKSTLINALLNYSMGVKFEDEVWFQIVEKENRNQYESQTSDVIVYEIFGYEDETLPYSLTIIDTPGYGDTRGIEHDDIISHKLLHLFRSEDGVHEVHSVGVVMKSTDNRLSDRTMYAFDSVMSLFGRDVENNIVVLITHSNGRRPKNALQAVEAAKHKYAQNEKNEPAYFLFDNCQDEQRKEKYENFLKNAYELSERGMREFIAFLGKTAPQKLEKTVEVLNERIKLTACIQNIQERIKMTEAKQTEIRQIQEALKKHEEKMEKNENFTVEVDEVYKDKEPIAGWIWGFSGEAVSCTVCEETCQYPGCTLKFRTVYSKIIRWSSDCTVCSGKCPESVHKKEKFRYVTKTRKVKKTLEEMKLKYEKNKTESEKKLSLLENFENEMKQLTAERSELLDESYQHVISLEQIALKADSVSTVVHLDFLIEKMKEEGDTEKVQKLEEMRSRVDEGTRAALHYKQYL
ncbi:uncharacterized protein LOC115776291 [Archocentrus centrarchus]|uniref:uncharacterized protein LOC115776291 n=1 Tax=Archocentrus centrarchus TaxID=63155 RepID=UPI0011E9BC49|nr:uncharacterized protein LOC115776291 [Archocentrus centrarchus]